MNRVRQLGATLKSMGVDVDDEYMTMAALNGLPARYEYIITALEAVSDGEFRFKYDLVKSQLRQEEQRAHMRTEADHVDGSALFNRTTDVAMRNVPRCGHCQRIGHTEDRCWELYPETHYSGRPNRGTNGKSLKGTSNAADKSGTALAANDSGTAQPSDTPEDGSDFVCLMAKEKVSPSISCSDQSVSSASSLTWHIDSGASAHMTFDRSAFSSYTKVDPFSVELGDKSTSVLAGRGDVGINVKVNGGERLCILQDVLHIPDFAYSLVSVSALVERDITVSFDKVRVPISRNTCVPTSGFKAGNLFVLDAVRAPLVANLDLWHQRLGHVQRAGFLQMARGNFAKGLNIATKQRGTDTHNGNLCSDFWNS